MVAGLWAEGSALFFVLVVIILSGIINLLLCQSILRTHRAKHITHLYTVSMSVATMLHAIFNFPSNVITDFFVPSVSFDRICIVWIFTETMLCHTMLLHLLGSSLDTYLRLQMPHWYSPSGGRPATRRLKLAAPWIVSSLQTIAQVLLGDPRPPSRLESGRLCTCPDVNFLILRTCVAFGLPLLASIIILFLAAYRLQQSYSPLSTSWKRRERLVGGRTVENERANGKDSITDGTAEPRGSVTATSAVMMQSENSRTKAAVLIGAKIDEPVGGFRTPTDKVNVKTERPDLKSPTTTALSPLSPVTVDPYTTVDAILQTQTGESNSSDTGVSSQTTNTTGHTEGEHEYVPFHTCKHPTTMNQTSTPVIKPSGIENCQLIAPCAKESSENWLDTPSSDDGQHVKLMDHFCPQHGHVTLSFQPEVDNPPTVLLTVNDDAETTDVGKFKDATDKSSFEEPTMNSVPRGAESVPRIDRGGLLPSLSIEDNFQSSSLRRLGLEKVAIKTNMVTCALSIALWAPYITATLAHLLLQATRFTEIINTATLIQFKWLAYLTSIAYAVGYLVVDRGLRRQVFQSCRCRRRNRRTFMDVPQIYDIPNVYSCIEEP